MGFNTGILLLNDAIPQAEACPAAFGKNLLDAVSKYGLGNRPVDFSIGNHANGGTVIHQAHADFTGVIAIGGNSATTLGCSLNHGVHHTDEAKEKLLRQLAENMGFRLVRKKHPNSGRT